MTTKTETNLYTVRVTMWTKDLDSWSWREAFFGGLIAAVGFTIGKYFIGLYIGNNQSLSVYGAARSAFVLLLWIYYAAQIILTGALCARLLQDRDGKIPWPPKIQKWLEKRYGA